MVHPDSETSNTLCEELEEWDDYLENHTPRFQHLDL